MLASKFGHYEIILYLLNYGADATMTDNVKLINLLLLLLLLLLRFNFFFFF